MRDIVSRPGYSHDEDGLDDLMEEAALSYAIQGKVFAGESYLSRNSRQAEIWSRDVLRARATSKETPVDQPTLEEYHEAYRSYINHRHRNRREEAILEEKPKRPEKSQSSHDREPYLPEGTDQATTSPKKGKWKWIPGKRPQLHTAGAKWQGGTFDVALFYALDIGHTFRHRATNRVYSDGNADVNACQLTPTRRPWRNSQGVRSK